MSSATVPLLDDTIPFGDEELINNSSGNLTHPYITFFHLFFRISSIVVYLLCQWFSESFITNFVVVVLLLSMDFWTVKNITGRLMVGLRWWNYVDDDGKSHWVYEARKGPSQNRINEHESRIFWIALILTPLFWCVLLIIALFGLKLKWMLLVTIAIILNGANLYGYIKCKVGASESLRTVTSNFFREQVLQSAVSMVTRQASAAAAPASNPITSPVNTI